MTSVLNGRMNAATSHESAGDWFAVVDAARDCTFLHLPPGAVTRRQSLYSGELGAMLDDVAPHLVAFGPASGFADWLRGREASDCAILLRSSASFDELRKHLRRFLVAKDASGKQYRLRFYDPRVLRVFLPSCDAPEAAGFFGPVRQFRAPGPAGVDFALKDGRLSATPIAAAS